MSIASPVCDAFIRYVSRFNKVFIGISLIGNREVLCEGELLNDLLVDVEVEAVYGDCSDHADIKPR